MGEACSKHGDRRGAHRVLVGKHEGKKPLRRPRHRWKDNSEMDFQEVGLGLDLIDLVHNTNRWRAFVKSVMNLQVPQKEGNFLTSWEPVSFSRMTLFHGVNLVSKLVIPVLPHYAFKTCYRETFTLVFMNKETVSGQCEFTLVHAMKATLVRNFGRVGRVALLST